jgi:hypothetical protein
MKNRIFFYKSFFPRPKGRGNKRRAISTGAKEWGNYAGKIVMQKIA